MMLRDSLDVTWAEDGAAPRLPRATSVDNGSCFTSVCFTCRVASGMGCAERRTGFGFVPWAADCGARPAAGHLGT